MDHLQFLALPPLQQARYARFAMAFSGVVGALLSVLQYAALNVLEQGVKPYVQLLTPVKWAYETYGYLPALVTTPLLTVLLELVMYVQWRRSSRQLPENVRIPWLSEAYLAGGRRPLSLRSKIAVGATGVAFVAVFVLAMLLEAPPVDRGASDPEAISLEIPAMTASMLFAAASAATMRISWQVFATLFVLSLHATLWVRGFQPAALALSGSCYSLMGIVLGWILSWPKLQR